MEYLSRGMSDENVPDDGLADQLANEIQKAGYETMPAGDFFDFLSAMREKFTPALHAVLEREVNKINDYDPSFLASTTINLPKNYTVLENNVLNMYADQCQKANLTQKETGSKLEDIFHKLKVDFSQLSYLLYENHDTSDVVTRITAIIDGSYDFEIKDPTTITYEVAVCKSRVWGYGVAYLEDDNYCGGGTARSLSDEYFLGGINANLTPVHTRPEIKASLVTKLPKTGVLSEDGSKLSDDEMKFLKFALNTRYDAGV